MTQALFINGIRPKSKKHLKDTVAAGRLHDVHLEATSVFGNEYNGPLDTAPKGDYYVVIPSQFERKSFAHIRVTDKGIVVK